jgi:hypothetical protein
VDPNFYVFLAFGQSNMEGNAAVPSPAPPTYSRYQELSPVTCGSRTQGKWATATSPIVRCDTKYSLLEYFGKTLVDSLPSNIKIGIVPVAVGGTPIWGFMPNGVGKAFYASLAGTSSSYMLTWANEYGGDPYARLVAMGKIAQQTGVIKGILLHQGETDAYKSGWADSVKTIYNSILSDLSLKAADVPLLAGEVYNNAGQIAAIDALPKTITTSYVISSKDCPAQSDNLHFTVPGYQTLGTRYAQQMLKLLPKSTAISPSTKAANLTYNADYVVFDVRGTRVAGFHATDAASMDLAWTGAQKNLPNGIYWIRNASTGMSQRVLAGR